MPTGMQVAEADLKEDGEEDEDDDEDENEFPTQSPSRQRRRVDEDGESVSGDEEEAREKERARRARRKVCRAIIDEYYRGSYHGQSSATLLYQLAKELRKDSNAMLSAPTPPEPLLPSPWPCSPAFLTPSLCTRRTQGSSRRESA